MRMIALSRRRDRPQWVPLSKWQRMPPEQRYDSVMTVQAEEKTRVYITLGNAVYLATGEYLPGGFIEVFAHVPYEEVYHQ